MELPRTLLPVERRDLTPFYAGFIGNSSILQNHLTQILYSDAEIDKNIEEVIDDLTMTLGEIRDIIVRRLSSSVEDEEE